MATIRKGERELVWRGSVRDLATDLSALLTSEQRAELAVALTTRSMAEDRGVEPEREPW